MCDIEECNLSSHIKNKCILHSDDKNKNIKEFWEKINSRIDEVNKRCY